MGKHRHYCPNITDAIADQKLEEKLRNQKGFNSNTLGYFPTKEQRRKAKEKLQGA